MTQACNIIFIVVLCIMCFINGKILLDSNIERFFKQGRVGSIRLTYLIVSFVFAFLFAFGLKELILAIYNTFSNF